MGREAFGKLTRLKQSQHTNDLLLRFLNTTFTFLYESSFCIFFVQLNWINIHILFFSLVLRHEGQLFKTLLSDYEARQRELLLENAELNKVLQQMKGEITSILGSNKSTLTGDDDVTQVRGDWAHVTSQCRIPMVSWQPLGYLEMFDHWSLSLSGQVWGWWRSVWFQ